MAVFRRFFERIVEECSWAGLVWGEELFFDATKVEANASIDSVRLRSLVEGRMEEHLAGAFPEDIPFAQEEDLPGAVVAGFVGPEVDERREFTRQNALRHRWIENNGRQERESLRWGYRRLVDLRVSTTDPDASPCTSRRRARANSAT